MSPILLFYSSLKSNTIMSIYFSVDHMAQAFFWYEFLFLSSKLKPFSFSKLCLYIIFFLLSLFCVDHFFFPSHLSFLLASIPWCDFSDGSLWWWMWSWFLRWIYFFPLSIYFLSLPAHVSSPPVLCFELFDSLGAMYLIFIWAVAIFFWCGFITWHLFFPHFSSFSWKVLCIDTWLVLFCFFIFVSEVNPSSYLWEVPSQDRPEQCSRPELTFFGSELSFFMAQRSVCTFILPSFKDITSFWIVHNKGEESISFTFPHGMLLLSNKCVSLFSLRSTSLPVLWGLGKLPLKTHASCSYCSRQHVVLPLVLPTYFE